MKKQKNRTPTRFDSVYFTKQNKNLYTKQSSLSLCVQFSAFCNHFFSFFLFAFITNYDYYDDDGNDFGSGWNPWNHHPTNNKFVSSFSISCYCSVWLKSIDVIFLINYNIGIYFNNWFFFFNWNIYHSNQTFQFFSKWMLNENDGFQRKRIENQSHRHS